VSVKNAERTNGAGGVSQSWRGGRRGASKREENCTGPLRSSRLGKLGGTPFYAERVAEQAEPAVRAQARALRFKIESRDSIRTHQVIRSPTHRMGGR
jgi:hypothetical protein